jgi:hypothetical protein
MEVSAAEPGRFIGYFLYGFSFVYACCSFSGVTEWYLMGLDELV